MQACIASTRASLPPHSTDHSPSRAQIPAQCTITYARARTSYSTSRGRLAARVHESSQHWNALECTEANKGGVARRRSEATDGRRGKLKSNLLAELVQRRKDIFDSFLIAHFAEHGHECLCVRGSIFAEDLSCSKSNMCICNTPRHTASIRTRSLSLYTQKNNSDKLNACTLCANMGDEELLPQRLHVRTEQET